jgi:hypothetical protein
MKIQITEKDLKLLTKPALAYWLSYIDQHPHFTRRATIGQMMQFILEEDLQFKYGWMDLLLDYGICDKLWAHCCAILHSKELL